MAPIMTSLPLTQLSYATWQWVHHSGQFKHWTMPRLLMVHGAIFNVPSYGLVQLRDIVSIGIVGQFYVVTARGLFDPNECLMLINYATRTDFTVRQDAE